MKEARIEIIGHDGEVDQKVPWMQWRDNIRELLNQGFHHDTSITIGNCSFGVFTKDAEVACQRHPQPNQQSVHRFPNGPNTFLKSIGPDLLINSTPLAVFGTLQVT
jgi:hypothetical protein